MMENKTYFRSAVVGGYNKNDVHRCIQELKKVTEEELLTSEEIISELNVQIEEQKNEFETMLEEQKVDSEARIEEERNRYEELKDRYDDMLADIKEEYEVKIVRLEEELELQKNQVKEVVEPIVVDEPVVESQVHQQLAMVETSQQELDTWKAKCENWNEKYDELYNENRRLVAKYDSLVAETDELKKHYHVFLEKKDIVFNYEMDSRARADQIVVDAELEAKKRLQEAEAKIILMIQESKGRIDSTMTKYVSLCDGYREQTHVSAFAAMKLQKQMEELILQLSNSNRMIKQKVSALYSQTDKGIDMFKMDIEEELGFLDGE